MQQEIAPIAVRPSMLNGISELIFSISNGGLR